MADILKAIEKEKEYLAHRMKGEEPFHLVDTVKECGFETLNDYFSAKTAYQFERLNFIYAEKAPVACLAEVFRMMEEKVTGVLFVTSDETFVFKGTSDKYFDAEYCEENGIPIYELHTSGGSIVSAVGDLSLGICVPASVNARSDFILAEIGKILSKYHAFVEVTSNDILIDGGKVCGSACYTRNGMFMWVAHFSFNDNSELIEKICGVSGSVKTPAVITNLTANEFRQEVAAWLRVQST